MYITVASKKRRCNLCDKEIPAGTQHLAKDQSMSSGFRLRTRRINFCQDCAKKRIAEEQWKLGKFMASLSSRPSSNGAPGNSFNLTQSESEFSNGYALINKIPRFPDPKGGA